MPTIFLSYARLDAASVQALAGDLRALRNTVWLDEEVDGGQPWWNHILEQIRACDMFVFALSPVALKSVSCRRESEYAAALGKPVLPMLVAEGVPTAHLPPALAMIQYVDYRERTSDTSLHLARALNAIPSAPPLPEPLPRPPDVPLSYLGQLAAQISGDAPLSFEMQSALVLELRRSFTDSKTTADAHELLIQLRDRRDLLARIGEEIDEALGITRHQRPSPLRTILLTVVMTVVCLGLVAFFFRDTLVDSTLRQLRQSRDAAQRQLKQVSSALEKVKEQQQALEQSNISLQRQVDTDRKQVQADIQALEIRRAALQKERDALQQDKVKFQQKLASLEQDREVKLEKAQKALEREKVARQAEVGTAEKRVRAVKAELVKSQEALTEEKAARHQERDELQRTVSELQGKLQTQGSTWIAGPTHIRTAQDILRLAGHDPGPTDGLLGPGTIVVLRQYQAQQGLPSTGKLDETTWLSLRQYEVKQRGEAHVSESPPTVGDTWREPITGMTFVYVPAGCFQMGSPLNEVSRDNDEGPQHEVCLDEFWLGQTEVTNAQYRLFKQAHGSGSYQGNSLNSDTQPVVRVSWHNAVSYCQWLGEQTGRDSRLSTEAEWEYACRAGTETPRYADDLDTIAWYAVNRRGGSQKVGQKLPNAWGLYDMLGNVYEWVQDRYSADYYSKSSERDPRGPDAGASRVLRGGHWFNSAQRVRAAYRNWDAPGDRLPNIGFRCLSSGRDQRSQ